MRLPYVLTLASLTLAAALAGCAAPGSADGEALESDDSALVAAVSPADVARAEALEEIMIWLPDPKLGPGARMRLLRSSEFDGTASADYLVKDEDGRLFLLTTVNSNPDQSSLSGQHGAPPRFADARYFLMLDEKAIEWALSNLPRVPSTRHGQILSTMVDPDFASEVKDLGKLPNGDTLVFFNNHLFVVAPSGFADVCKPWESNVASCAQAWQRVNNWDDPFDAR